MNNTEEKPKEIIDEPTERLLSTISVFINCHGEDILNKPLTINPNVRMLSYAGKSCCLSFLNVSTLDALNSISQIFDANTLNSSTYNILQQIADAEREKYKETALKSIKHKLLKEKNPAYINEFTRTKTCLESNLNLKITTPVIDQKYKFYDILHSFSPDNLELGIYVLDVRNPSSKTCLTKGFIIKHLMKYMGKQQVYSNIEKKYKDIEHCSPQEITFGDVENVQEILLSELLNYLIVENGFDVVNIIHKTCRTTDDFVETLMLETIDKETAESRLIDQSAGGKIKKKRKYSRKSRKTFRKTRKYKKYTR
jgi:hypothetical protein